VSLLSVNCATIVDKRNKWTKRVKLRNALRNFPRHHTAAAVMKNGETELQCWHHYIQGEQMLDGDGDVEMLDTTPGEQFFSSLIYNPSKSNAYTTSHSLSSPFDNHSPTSMPVH
jgi:hypothetical protein